MSEKYKVLNPEGIYFVTFTVIDWIDLFTRPAYKQIISDSLKYCVQNKGLIIYAYVLMPSHLHLIVSSSKGYALSETIRDFKKYTSKKLIQCIKECSESRKEWILGKFSFAASRIKRGENYKLWQDGFHPVELETNKMINQRLDYLHNNPVEDEIVENPEEYLYSSARNYCGRIGLIEVSVIE
ncbi:MAG: transposase [Bacteroidales bacterium]|nr:transposase [Bacteroidales bacterium]